MLAQPVLADDYIYRGDCTRAEAVMNERSLLTLFPHRNYVGAQYGNWANRDCMRSDVFTYKLNTTYRDSRRIELSLQETAYLVGNQSGTCADPVRWSTDVYGTVILTLEMSQVGSVCEVFVKSAWSRRQTSSPNWKNEWSNRVQILNSYSFVIAQGESVSPKFITPLSFTKAP